MYYILFVLIFSRLPEQQFVGEGQLLYDKTETYAQEANQQRATAYDHQFHYAGERVAITGRHVALQQIGTYAVRQSEQENVMKEVNLQSVLPYDGKQCNKLLAHTSYNGFLTVPEVLTKAFDYIISDQADGDDLHDEGNETGS